MCARAMTDVSGGRSSSCSLPCWPSLHSRFFRAVRTIRVMERHRATVTGGIANMIAPDHTPPADTASTASSSEFLHEAGSFFAAIVDRMFRPEGCTITGHGFDHLLHLASLLPPQLNPVADQVDAADAIARRTQLATALEQALTAGGWERIDMPPGWPGRIWRDRAGEGDEIIIPDTLTTPRAASLLGETVVALVRDRGVSPSQLFIDLLHP